MSGPDLNSGALAPVADEVNRSTFKVQGEIPRELNGTLIRNGPNPLNGRFSGTDVLGWWPEAAMLHAIRFADGEVCGYRNRWVRTNAWAQQQTPVASHPGLVDSNPNVNLIKHAGTLLALAEGQAPAAVTTELETLGLPNTHQILLRGTTAHPKVDPVTNELITFHANWAEPWLRYSVLDAAGAVTVDLVIDVPAPAMMHDFAITQTHSIFLDLNVGYDFSMFEQGYQIPIRWLEERRSRLGVIPRHGSHPNGAASALASVRWFDIEPCFIQHVINAYDAPDGTLVLDVVRYPWYFKAQQSNGGFRDNPLAQWWRYTIDLNNNAISEQQMSPLDIELPRINESRTAAQHRYFYCVLQPTDQEMRGIVRFDTRDAIAQLHEIEPGDQNSEPVFVPNPYGSAEDDGWILICVYRHATHTNDVCILRADDITAKPVAVIELDRRIPAGFHGVWVPAD